MSIFNRVPDLPIDPPEIEIPIEAEYVIYEKMEYISFKENFYEDIPKLIATGTYKELDFFVYNMFTYPCVYVRILTEDALKVLEKRGTFNITYVGTELHGLLPIENMTILGWDFAGAHDWNSMFLDHINVGKKKYTVEELIRDVCVEIEILEHYLKEGDFS